MPYARDLSYTSEVETSDQIIIYKTAEGQFFRAPASALIPESSSTLDVQRVTITSEATTISLTGSTNTWLIIKHDVADESDGDVTLNLPGSPVDEQEVSVSYKPTTTEAIATVLFLGTSPEAGAINQYAEFYRLGGETASAVRYPSAVKFKYDATDDFWYEL